MNRLGVLPLKSWHRYYQRLGKSGQTLVEYALILAIISIVAIGVLINIGQGVKGVYSMVDSQIASAPTASH